MAQVDLLVVLIIIVALLLLFTIFALIYASGIFHQVVVGTGKPPIGQAIIAYKFSNGSYSGSGQLFTELAALLKPEQKTVGIYYDDPKTVPSNECRYVVGAILAENDEVPDEDQKKKLLEEGYKIFMLPAVSYAVKTDFPFTSYLSIMIAVLRVYPRLSQYVKDRKLCAHPFLEIYDGSTIHFMAPLAKQDEFYVEEAEVNREDSEDLDESVGGSSYGGSVSRSEFSVATSYMSSIIEDSDDDSDDVLRLDEVKEEPSETPIKEISVNDSAEREVTLDDIQKCVLPELSIGNDMPTSVACFQDSGFSSEQALTPAASPDKKTENDQALKPEDHLDIGDGNESSSSFEVIDDKPEL